MPEVLLEATDVSYRTGGVKLVEGVDFEAAAGELVAVLGPNGAGKSTLMRLLAGDLLPSSGNVTISGRSTSEWTHADFALLRAVLSDHIPVDIPFTVRSVVSMGRFPHRRDPDNTAAKDDAAVLDSMRRTDTERFAGRAFSTLSSGERLRVFLARVLAQDAPIVLLDEPTASLDVANREHILSEAARLTTRGRAVVIVLHDLNAAAFYADRLVLMAGGTIRAIGPPREVLLASLLTDVYGQPMRVIDHPFRDCPLVLVADESP